MKYTLIKNGETIGVFRTFRLAVSALDLQGMADCWTAPWTPETVAKRGYQKGTWSLFQDPTIQIIVA